MLEPLEDMVYTGLVPFDYLWQDNITMDDWRPRWAIMAPAEGHSAACYGMEH